MNSYYKVIDKKYDISNLYIIIDTLNAYVPGHFDKLMNRNVPTSGGFCVIKKYFNNNCVNLNICGNYEEMSDVYDFIRCDNHMSENADVAQCEISEEKFMIFYKDII